jgi:hypothetical protein
LSFELSELLACDSGKANVCHENCYDHNIGHRPLTGLEDHEVSKIGWSLCLSESVDNDCNEFSNGKENAEEQD